MSKFSHRLRQATWRPLSEESRSDHLASIESAVEAEAVRVRAPVYHRLPDGSYQAIGIHSGASTCNAELSS